MAGDAEGGAGTTVTSLPDSMLDAEMKLKVKGQERSVTVREIADAYKKVEGADATFREAHDIKASAEKALDVSRDLAEGVKEGDMAKLRRAFANAGATQEQLDQIFNPSRPAASATPNSDSESVDEEADGDDDDPRVRRLEEALQQQGAELQRLNQAYEGAKTARRHQDVRTQVVASVDSESELGKILASKEKAGRDSIYEMLFRQVAKASETLPWGPRAIQDGIDRTIAELKAIGVAGDQDPSGASNPVDAFLSGIGPSASTAGRLYRSSKPTERVSVRDASYAQGVMSRIADKLRGK